MKMIAWCASSACFMLAVPATAQPAPAQATDAPTSGHFEGFRSARFGQTEPEVRAAIAKDFQVPAEAIQRIPVPDEGTQALITTLPQLAPGPGPVQLSYILGATSHRLVRVNLIWSNARPSDDERKLFAAAGVALADFFRKQPAQPKASGPGGQIGPNAVAIYVAADDHGAALEIEASGIAFEATDAQDKVTKSPAPSGSAVLRLSYIANVLHPDVVSIKPGAF